MAETLDCKKVASTLNTEPRKLRRFLREDSTYMNVGQGGRYKFTYADLEMLRERFTLWQEGVNTRRAKRNTTGLMNNSAVKVAAEEEAEPAVIEIPKCTPALRKLEAEQIARLERRLRECGLHVTQMKDRRPWSPTWTPVRVGEMAS